MKPKTLLTAIAMALGVVLVAWSAAHAAFSKTTYGTLKDITANSVAVVTDNQGEDQFNVNQDTKYRNVNSLTDLRAGDRVSIDYKEDHGRKVISEIGRANSTANPSYSTTGWSNPNSNGVTSGRNRNSD